MRTHPRDDPRHRLEHVYLWEESQLQRAAELGVVVSSQPEAMATIHDWMHAGRVG